MRRLVTVGVVLLAPALCMAQMPKYELSAMLGSRWGGSIFVDDQAFQHREVKVDINDEGAYGLRFGVALAPYLQFELMVNRQDTTLKDESGLFGEEPGGFIPPGETGILDLDLTYYHGGLLWQWVHGDYRWYTVASVGVTHITPSSPLPADTRLSGSLGGGLKLDLSDRLALRFEGRYYLTLTDEGSQATQYFEHQDCEITCYYTWRYDERIVQTELSLGIVLKF